MKRLLARTPVIILVFLLGISLNGPYQPAVFAAAAPDLTVPGITLSPAEPALGDTVTITAAVKNQGDARAPSSYLTVYADGDILDNRLINSIDAGMAATAVFSWKATGGTHTIKAIADSSGIIAETDESNNTGTYSFTTLAIDLTVTSIKWSPSNPSKGDEVTFTITVKNQGTYKSSYTGVSFYIDGGTRGIKDVPAMGPGATATVTYTWPALPGQHILKAVIDEINNNDESDEANNEFTATFSTLPPDLTAEKITWTPSNPSKDDTVQFTVTVRNQGMGRAGVSHLGYFIDGEFMAAVDVPALDAGASCDVTFSWTAAVDMHDIRVMIDYFQMVNESEEANNELTVSLLTVPPDLVISGLQWSPAAPAAGDPVTFTAVLKNQGGGRAEASRAVLYIDGAIAGYLDYPVVEAGAEQSAILTWTACSGSHAISISADYLESVPESREDNNRYNTSITVIPPDLIVTDIIMSPEKPSVGETVTLTVVVKNRGGGKSLNFKLAGYIDEQMLSVRTMSALAAGVSANTTFTWKIQNGRHTFKAAADYNNEQTEENEKNNTAAREIAPDMPDLSVTNVTWSPPEFTAGEETVFTIDIENLGGVAAGVSRAVYYVDDAIAGFTDIGEICAVEKTSLQFVWPAAAGHHVIRIVVDARDQVTEIDEGNNAVAVNIPPPDLAVTEITFSPQDAAPGDTVVITATVINQGPGDAPPALAVCYSDGVKISEDAMPGLAAGSVYESSFTWTARPGVHNFTIRADAFNTAIETDETNNEASAAFTAATPDLAIDGFKWQADNLPGNKEVRFTLTVKNQGAAPSGDFSVRYSFDAAPPAERSMASVPAGGKADVSFTSILADGQHTFNVFLDAAGDVTETDEANNESSIPFSTMSADLAVRSISWSPPEAKAGDTITITVKAENRGRAVAVNAGLSLCINGAEVGTAVIPEIPAGGEASADFGWTAAEGTHELLVLADGGGTIAESDETNNTRTRTLTFTKPSAPEARSPAQDIQAYPGDSLLDTWWWLLLFIGVAIGLGMLYYAIKNLRKSR